MKCKFWSQTILAVAAVTVSAVTAIGEPASATEPSFGCENIDGVWTTVANTPTGQPNPAFYWHSDALEPSVDAQEQCQRVSKKLQNAGGNHKFELKKSQGRLALYLKNPERDRFLFSASDSSKMKRIFPNMDRFLPQDQGDRGLQEPFGRPVSIWYLLGF